MMIRKSKSCRKTGRFEREANFLTIQVILASIVLVLVSAALLGCAKKPTSEECKAAIVHATEVQLDEAQEQSAALGPAEQGQSAEQLQKGIKLLKSAIPSQIRPEVVAQCVEHMRSDDIQCTMTATTSKELVEKCHWKVVAGPKGTALGF